jgi:hypothetical protein
VPVAASVLLLPPVKGVPVSAVNVICTAAPGESPFWNVLFTKTLKSASPFASLAVAGTYAVIVIAVESPPPIDVLEPQPVATRAKPRIHSTRCIVATSKRFTGVGGYGLGSVVARGPDEGAAACRRLPTGR